MNPFTSTLLKRKIATCVLITASLAAFATLGEGGKKKGVQKSLLSVRPAAYNFKSFSLRSGYQYRGNSVINSTAPGKFIQLNTVVTIQKGNQTFILPMKKKVLLDKVKIVPLQQLR